MDENRRVATADPGEAHRVTLIPGDGSGPELVACAVRVLEATGVPISWDLQPVRGPGTGGAGELIPGALLQSVRSTGAALKGPVTTVAGTGGPRSFNIALRNEAGIFANVRPARFLGGGRGARPDVDVVVMRETTEDLFAGVEFAAGAEDTRELLDLVARTGRGPLAPGAGVSLKPVSEDRSRRFLEFAFSYAERTGRRKVTAVHKATVMRATDGLFLEVARDVAAHHSLQFDDRLVDNVCAGLVRDPGGLDVLVSTALYGDILSDLAASLVGGVGVAPGANFGDSLAIFEAVHGSAPRHAGKGRLNPIALILSGAMLLDHLGEPEAAGRVERAVIEVVSQGRSLTYDLAEPGCASSTEAVADAVAALVA